MMITLNGKQSTIANDSYLSLFPKMSIEDKRELIQDIAKGIVANCYNGQVVPCDIAHTMEAVTRAFWGVRCGTSINIDFKRNEKKSPRAAATLGGIVVSAGRKKLFTMWLYYKGAGNQLEGDSIKVTYEYTEYECPK